MVRLASPLLALSLLVSCERADVAAPRPIGPSPLLTVDPDRLYILVVAGNRMNKICEYYYRDPNDPRYSQNAGVCARWEREALDWLHANGVPTAVAEHLREPAFWAWYTEKDGAIDRCMKTALHKGFAMQEGEVDACSPLQRIEYVEHKTLEEAGFHRPEGSLRR